MEYQVLSRRNLWLSRLSFLHELVLVPVIALLVVAGSLMNPNFLTTSNLVNNILVSSAVLGLLAIAESLLVISGVIDLSLESTVAIAPAIGAWIVLPAGKGVRFNPEHVQIEWWQS